VTLGENAYPSVGRKGEEKGKARADYQETSGPESSVGGHEEEEQKNSSHCSTGRRHFDRGTQVRLEPGLPQEGLLMGRDRPGGGGFRLHRVISVQTKPIRT